MSERYTYGGVTQTYVTNYEYDVADQLVSISQGGEVSEQRSWTLNGTLASIDWGGGGFSFASDLTDELVSQTDSEGVVVSCTVDASGNRTSRSVNGDVEATWAWDELSALPTRVGEYDAEGLVTSWLPDPVSSTGSALAEGDGATSAWLLADPFANVTGAVTVGGTSLAGSQALYAFGESRTGSQGVLGYSHLGFAGQYLDSQTYFYDMRARDYDPYTGTFLATDPVAVQTGSPYFGTYVYGMNSPLVFIDPSGMTACGPIGSDCNGANLVAEFRRLERAGNDAAYLTLYRSLTDTQINEIPFDEMSYIHSEAENRQIHQWACEASPGECWAPCPEDSYERCQLERGALGVAMYAAPMALGIGASALAARLCAGRAAAAATSTAATEAGVARFTVNSAGEATMSLRLGTTSLEVSEHAALRMAERGISIKAAEATLAQRPFQYFHGGVWKTGYYDPVSRIFLGTVNGEVTTVIRNASPNYISNLKAATP